uniref:Tetratricopeptide repeat protein 8 n=1 Tax=Setaria digitata TaxID=48799 RepID=A0A915Q3P7_9BILA
METIPKRMDVMRSEKYSNVNVNSMEVDPLLKALILFKHNDIGNAIKICTEILEKNPYDQVAWSLKLSCLAEEFYVDELENDERGVAETFLDDTILASRARPGTSLSRPITSDETTRQAIRPTSSAGRPISGILRPETHTRPGTLEQTLRTSRTSRATRATSSSSARFIRLGTASMISEPDGPFVNLSRLNVDKYAADPQVNRNLFEYIFYHEGDMKVAHQIAITAAKNANYTDWYWKNQVGKCCYRLGMFNDALKQFQSSLNNQKMAETYAYLAKQLGNIENSIEAYKLVLEQDPTNIEAIACIANNYFYDDQPEIALRYYRRILQMGVSSAELFMNLGLCCFFCQQFDLAISCIERAQASASDEVVADVWYNTGNILLSSGDVKMASRCFRLAMAADPNHAESVCNFGILQMRDGKIEQSRSLFRSAIEKGPHLFEPYYNLALLAYQSRKMVLKALELFPEHVHSKTILGHIEQMLHTL